LIINPTFLIPEFKYVWVISNEGNGAPINDVPKVEPSPQLHKYFALRSRSIFTSSNSKLFLKICGESVQKITGSRIRVPLCGCRKILAAGRSCLIRSFKDLRITFLRTGAIRGFGFTWRIILRAGLGVGLVVGIKEDLGTGRDVCLGLRGVRLPVITSAPFSTVKSIQVLVQSVAIEKVLGCKVNISEKATSTMKNLKAN
jgi:hypothetical protein